MNAEILSFRRKIRNRISISGFKHLLAPLISAVLLHDSQVTFHNVPEISEKKIFCEILATIGKKFSENLHTLTLYPSEFSCLNMPESLTKLIHGSIYLMPVILQKEKVMKVFETGGCRIGSDDTYSTRPVAHILKTLQAFGAKRHENFLSLEGGYIHSEINIMDYSQRTDILCGPYVSGATKTAILCASVCNGKSKIINPYMKADVIELLAFIEKLGCHVCIKDNTLYISRPEHNQKDVTYYLCPDLIEIITFIAIAVYLDINLEIFDICTDKAIKYLSPEFSLLDKIGIVLNLQKNSIFIPEGQRINSTDIVVSGEGIYSDSQPFFTLILSRASSGTSTITELTWENRTDYAKELGKAGLNIKVSDNIISIKSGYACSGLRDIYAKDLRSAAALTIFALAHKGFVVHDIDHLSRGYENFLQKLSTLGAEVRLL